MKVKKHDFLYRGKKYDVYRCSHNFLKTVTTENKRHLLEFCFLKKYAKLISNFEFFCHFEKNQLLPQARFGSCKLIKCPILLGAILYALGYRERCTGTVVEMAAKLKIG